MTASDKIPPCTGRMDGGCVANLVCRGCDLAASVAIVVALGRAVADAVADAVVELVGGGERGGDTTTGGGGGASKEGSLSLLLLTSMATVAELKATGSTMAVGGA